MQQTSITFIDENENIEHGINLLPEYKFYWNKNKVDIVLNKTIAKLIVEVTDKYTFINTKELMKLKNKHSIRLLPLLRKINGYTKRQKTLTISEVNAFFGTKYTAYDLERYVLSKAKKELDENCTLTVDFELNYDNVGQGRPKATSVTFRPIERNNYQTTIFTNIEAAAETEQKNSIDDWMPTGATLTRVEQEADLSPNHVMEKVREFKEYCKNNKKNYKNMDSSFIRYIRTALKNGWTL